MLLSLESSRRTGNCAGNHRDQSPRQRTTRPVCQRPFRRPLHRGTEALGLWLAMALLLFVQPLYSEASPMEAEGTGAFHFVGEDGQWQAPATLLTTEYQVTVSGLIADTRLVQHFANTSQQWREGVYVFPLPDNASVYGMTMKAGERVIVGEIHTRQEADRQYETARREGRQAAKVEQQRPNLFTTRLANIPPGETVSVELQYQQSVRYQSGEFELQLPTTLTPRYMPGEPLVERETAWQGGWATPTTEVPDADKISPFTVREGDVPSGSHRAQVQLTLNAGLPIATVTSPSHAVNAVWNGAEVSVTPQEGDILMDRDLIVRWAPVRGQEPSAALFHQNWQGEDYLLAMLVPGMSGRQSLPRELIFVIDTSGSMAGASIRQAKASLLKGLDTLNAGDRFNVIQFNSQIETLFRFARPADAENLASARRYVQSLEANGGTEMAPALDRALRQNHREAEGEEAGRYVRQVVFMTDGAVGNEQGLFRQISQQLGDSRLFTVGIGSAPNMHFMREAARFGRGTYTAINDLGAVSAPLDELFRKMESPVMTAIQTRWPDGFNASEALPQRPGDLFLGEPMVQVVRGRLNGGELVASGRLPDGSEWQQRMALDHAAEAEGLHRFWARARIDSLMDQSLSGQVSEDVRGEITGLGLAHQLVTRYTSFVAVDKTPVRPLDEDLETESVPTLLPQGSAASMLRYPQTATWWPLLTATGLLGLMFASAVLMLQRRVWA
ncbi:marine proteobacterial sortase target protein [Marinobacter zhejiangensis]|uniref:Ca-activated chloride channel family protein n=1 Tax=Marinobacter zhejiangensis TaxID=488535 RepID=A0A1I4L9B3_9GAMM|nr:marine proteobacterial sortase target protein [Marinobacter zhejiangensis]SFL87511.1 Ca-activated chloride channel family protein [Marinobacter zhejiangensis]